MLYWEKNLRTQNAGGDFVLNFLARNVVVINLVALFASLAGLMMPSRSFDFLVAGLFLVTALGYLSHRILIMQKEDRPYKRAMWLCVATCFLWLGTALMR